MGADNVISVVFTILSLLICFGCTIQAAVMFFQIKNKKIAVLACFVTIFLIIIFYRVDNYLIMSMVKQSMIMLFLCTMFRGEKWEKLGLSCVLVSVWEFTWIGISSIIDIFFIALSVSEVAAFERENRPILSIFVYMITALLIYLLFDRTKLSEGSFLHGGGKILFYTMMVLLLLVDLCNYGISRGVTMVSNANGAEYWNTTFNELFTHIEVVVLSALCMVICLSLLFGLNRLVGYIAMDSIHKVEISHYQTMLAQYKNQINVRHDMKNHLISMTVLAENEEWEKLKEYIARLCGTVAVGKEEIETGNRIVNAIVNINRQTAENNHIKFECEINIQKPLSIDDYELCVIWGNILDNALAAANAAKEEKCVYIQAEIVKKNLIINVKNSVKQHALSHKFGVQNFGTGLMNVSRIVQRKNGIMNVEMGRNIFELTIMLPIVMQTETAYDIK